MLAHDVLKELAKIDRYDVRPVDHDALDITDFRTVLTAVRAISPHAIINCAAYTNVDKAESQQALAMVVNALGPRNLAIACNDVGACLMHFSTDYVFDGEKESPYEIWDSPNPINVYGKSKLWGERYISSLVNRHFIIRTSWLFGKYGTNFVDTMLTLSKKDDIIRVVDDQKGAPTYTVDLAQASIRLLDTGCFGIYHITNSGTATWYEFAMEIYRQMGIARYIAPVSTDEFPRPAKRPQNSVLDSCPLSETIGHVMPDWTNALPRYLHIE